MDHCKECGTIYGEICNCPNAITAAAAPVYVLRLDWNAGDGIGIERSPDGNKWERVGYVNTGATNSTVDLAQDLVDAYNEKHR